MSNAPDFAVPDRRRFLKIALAGISSTLAAPLAFAADPPASGGKKPNKPAARPAPPAPVAGDPPEISDEGRALAEVVKQRYGQHLDAEQMEEIAKELTWRMRAGATLRGFKLANHDEPDFIFEA